MTFIRAIFGFLVILVMLIFLLSNRIPVDLNYWPFGFVLTLPLGAVVLAVLIFGFLLGLLAHLPGRLGAQRRARRAEKLVADLQARPAVPTPLP